MDRPTGGSISNVGVADLTWAKTAEDLQNIESISDVGLVLLAPGITGLGSIPHHNVGLVTSVPEGERTDMIGQVRMDGAFLAAGNPEATLLVVGQAVVAPHVETIGFRQVWIMGQALLPKSAQQALAPKLGKIVGQVFYYDDEEGEPRLLVGSERMGAAMLELVTESRPWMIVGDCTFEEDVTAELLRSKVSQIILIGSLRGPAALMPMLQVLTTQKAGSIEAME